MSVIAFIAFCEGVALIAACVVIYEMWREFHAERRELLDRLMARNFGEYAAVAPTVVKPTPRRRSMTDQVEAELEARRRAEEAAEEPAHA